MSISLEVTVIKAEGLPIVPLRIASKKLNCNSFVEVQYGDEKFVTETFRHTRSPTYNKVHTFQLSESISDSASLTVKVYHAGRTGKTLIGRTDCPLGALRGTKLENKFYQLKGSAGKAGRLSMQMKYTDPNATGGGGGGGGADAPPTASGDSGELDVGATEEELAQRKQNESLVKQDLGNLSTKPADYQIRVKIIQARSLQSNNSIDPVAKVSMLGQRQQTRKKRSTFSPWFDETFYFQVRESPAKLFEEHIDFEVYNSRSIRRDALIGVFKLDIGLIYQQNGHTFSRKWLMLSNPKEPSAGVKGYLKMSVSVLGQGEEAPPEDGEDTYQKDEDVEGNLLRPVGVESEPIDLLFKCFLGLDMPRADVSLKTGITLIDKITRQHDKEYCDPYVKIGFSGVNRRSSVQSNTYSPVWMEELHLPALLPSMCDDLMIRIQDSDLGFFLDSDDILGTAELSLGSISHSSGSGSGFLPCFGPAFVNFYGGTREFEMLPGHHAEDLNEGVGDGVAYRGRILCELVSQPGGEKTDIKRVDLPEYEKLRIETFGVVGKKRFMLKMELIDMNMISDQLASGAIEVEVSMGNWGNVNEMEVPVGTSVTTKLKASSDGSRYWFIGWEDKHPLLELYSEWEDVQYRMNSYNLLKRQAHIFGETVEALDNYLSFKGTHSVLENNNMYFKLKHSIERYIEDCRVTLPELPAAQFTRLDFNLLEMRREKRHQAEDAAKYLLSHPADDIDEAEEPGSIANKGGLLEQGVEAINDDFLVEMQSLHRRFTELVYDPQISIPDVIVWVLTNGVRRAFLRIPAVDLIYHSVPEYRGELFGTVQTKFMRLPKPYKGTESIAADIPAQIQLRAWFGPYETEKDWPLPPAGRSIYLSETYENQRLVPIKGWGVPGLPGDPSPWSDNFGKESRDKAKAELAPGLQWTGDWQIVPEELEVDPEASLDSVVEEIWQNQRWYPGKGWQGPGTHAQFSDIDMQATYEVERGKPTPDCLENTIELRKGWGWTDQWKIDHSRPADAYGWDYAVRWNSKEWLPGKKRKHLVRKRKWLRTRVRIEGFDFVEEAASEKADADAEGWEYCFRFRSNKPFHRAKRKHDFVRRRRWHRVSAAARWEREVEGEDGNFITIVEQDDAPPQIEAEQAAKMFSAGRFLMYDEPRHEKQFQLRAHIYQARNLIAEDDDGLSDPYVKIVFGHRTGKTKIVKKTLCPTWDQTILLDGLELSGGHLARMEKYTTDVEFLKSEVEDKISMLDIDDFDGEEYRRADAEAHLREELNAKLKKMTTELLAPFPRLLIELYDYDLRGRHDFLGRVVFEPHLLTIRTKRSPAPARLLWHDVIRYEAEGGQILCAFELIPSADAPAFPLPKSKKVKEDATGKFVRTVAVPDDIRPETELTRIDVLAWGLRRLPSFKKLSIGAPSVQFECGGVTVETEKLKSFQDFPNFGYHDKQLSKDVHTKLSFELFLPTKLYYAPPLNIRVFDNRKFGRKPLIGVHSIPNVMDFLIEERLRRDTALAAIHFGRRTFTLSGSMKRPPKGETRIAIGGAPGSPPMSPKTKRAKKKAAREHQVAQLPDPEFTDQTIDWWSKYYASPHATGAQGRTKKAKYTGNLVKIFPCALESVPGGVFNPCEIVRPFGLTRGRGEKQKDAGVFKGDFAVFDAEGENINTKWDKLPPRQNMDVVVRLYAVKAHSLMPKDTNGRSDPYIKVSLGKKTVVKDRKNYLPSTLNPVFGRSFDFEATIPLHSECTISLYDHDTISHDDLIGETHVDLEARLLSSARPLCGLPQIYFPDGQDKWRDVKKPKDMLIDYCLAHELEPPVFSKSDYVDTVMDADGQYYDEGGVQSRECASQGCEFLWNAARNRMRCSRNGCGRERITPTVTVALHGQRTQVYTAEFWDTSLTLDPKFPFGRPAVSEALGKLWNGSLDDTLVFEEHLQNAALRALHAAGMVPEHIETRTLYSPLQPGFPQGRLEMWLDIFPKLDGDQSVVPEAVDISPRIPDEMVLRVVIYNCDDVVLDEANLAGERMSDIYIKSFFRGMEAKRLKTDVHYRSLNGEGNFNWRHVHHFEFLPTEENIVVKKKKSFLSWSAEEMRLPPIFVLQIWDSDLFSKDDWLGECELNLTEFETPSLKSETCALPVDLPDECFHNGCEYRMIRNKARCENCGREQPINLFKAKQAKGWVPCGGSQREDPEYEVDRTGLRRKKLILSGKIEIEMELMSRADFDAKPNGNGRKEPNAFPFLEKPQRPPTSFFWLTSPLKAFRYIILTNYWQYILILTLLGVLIVYLCVFIYNSPHFMNDKAFNGDKPSQ